MSKNAETPHFFGILDAPDDRFIWSFMVNGANVVDSPRSYGSRRKARRAIAALPVVDFTAGRPRPIPLPTTRFELVEGVEPLIVGEPGRRRKRRKDRDAAAAREATELQRAAAAEAEVAGELREEAQTQSAIADELREEAATAVVAAQLGDEGAAFDAVTQAAIADELDADAAIKEAASEALAADAEAKTREARTRSRAKRAPRKPAS
jgi:hypothetical protein